MKENKMKPKIGDTVWCVINDCVFSGIVYALGKYSFILKGYEDKLLITYEWKYCDYGYKWFFDINEFDELLQKISEDYYEIVKED